MIMDIVSLNYKKWPFSTYKGFFFLVYMSSQVGTLNFELSLCIFLIIPAKYVCIHETRVFFLSLVNWPKKGFSIRLIKVCFNVRLVVIPDNEILNSIP